jgi:hypothetical protein
MRSRGPGRNRDVEHRWEIRDLDRGKESASLPRDYWIVSKK